MDISFATSRLRRLCTSPHELQLELGRPAARKVLSHIASLRAANTLTEFRHLPGRCRELERTRGRAIHLALVVSDRRRLIFTPADTPSLSNSAGRLDWGAVRSVVLLEITNSDQ